MPTRPPKSCAYCGERYTGPKCRCRSWAGSRWTPKRKSDPRWRIVRRQRLDLNPVCAFFGEIGGCLGVATVGGHLDGTDYADDSGEGSSWLNLDMTRALCSHCHATRTGRQSGAARRTRPFDGTGS